MTKASRKNSVIFCALTLAVFTNGACSSTQYADKADEIVERPQEGEQRESVDLEGLGAERWCSDFGQDGLEAMVERAWEGNLELKSAWARMERAKAVVDIADSGLWPSVEAGARGDYTSRSLRSGRAGGASWELSAAASYEVPLWGSVRKRAEAADLEVEAAEAEARSLAITLTSEVAEAWFDVVAQRERLELLEAQLKFSKDILEITKQRLRRGLVGALDVAQQERNIESLQGLVSQVRGQLATSRNRLAVLIGESPEERRKLVEGGGLPAVEPIPEAGVPADLLERRPDVRAAHLRLRAADARTAAAVADKLPRLRLSAAVGFQSANLVNLFEQLFFSVGAGLTQPLFEGGRLNAEVDRSEAVAREQLYDYGQTLLVAIREVRDALDLEQTQRERIESLSEEMEIAQRVLELARKRYRTGSVRYLQVLTALEDLQQVERTLLEARRQQISNRISLCRALGGSWVESVASSLSEVSGRAGERESR